MAHLVLTLVAMPIVINAKNITSSRGFFTGLLNLTIERAPIIPSDRAKLLDITFVITKVIGGNNKKVIK